MGHFPPAVMPGREVQELLRKDVRTHESVHRLLKLTRTLFEVWWPEHVPIRVHREQRGMWRGPISIFHRPVYAFLPTSLLDHI